MRHRLAPNATVNRPLPLGFCLTEGLLLAELGSIGRCAAASGPAAFQTSDRVRGMSGSER